MPIRTPTHTTQIAIRSIATVLIFISAFAAGEIFTLRSASASENAPRKVFLPIAADSYRNSPPLIVGVYPPSYLGTQSAINSQLKELDNWAGKGSSIAGLFLDFNDPNPNYNVRVPLELLWDNGYTAFVNLMTGRRASDLAAGREDANIREVAAAFAYWMALAQQNQEQRFVFLAPLPEANITSGNVYGGDPSAFKSAFWRIQDIFVQEFAKQNVPYDSIRWVFAPNGVDEPGRPAFEAYYPGQDHVDLVAFSSYNWGYCVGWEYDEWQLGPELYLPFVQRMHSLAPGKPIFISQTASTSEYPYPNNYNYAQKSQWFIDTYTYLTGLDGVRGVLYFNIDAECDWTFFRSGSVYFDGYRQVISGDAFTYLPPAQMQSAFP